ncbi:energy transducer TonB [Owenweeksia hongkongensis]|uniref:TonB family protein n=1 Tax=Owenweeksia hongkongensis (strain DSM 17368 / CIP 108786 / JCM 12287 / NRRL B-23963 / UST20020801) TaxID=926562 RepID=G8R298_OWEHD|nr:energy transducer TonB [Owenweeksia hongkongensis]AEV32888.1 TonB family protein [Owenweeksia hongkongensis DSM 17368]
MEPKKNPKADLEQMRGIFLQVGLVIALVLSIVMIQWRTSEGGLSDLGEVDVEIDDEIIPITQRQTAPPPPPPPPPPEVIEVVEDDVELEEELEIQSTETDETEEVEIIEMEEEVSDEVLSFAVVESVPVFPGCEEASTNDEKKACFQQQILKYVGKNFKFPEMARQMGIQGRVYVNFVIEKNGAISNVQVVRGVDQMLDDEAVRVVKSLPKMTPAKQRGKSVRMSFTLPINAKLQ